MATYNEAVTIGPLLADLIALPLALNIVVVDDGSPDGTGRLAEAFAADHPGRVIVLHRPGKLGYASAHRLGIATALEQGGGRVVTMDADGSHDPRIVPALAAALDGCDLAIGSRYVAGGGVVGWGWFRRFLSSFGGRRVTRLLTGLRPQDCTSGFRAYRAELLGAIDLAHTHTEGYGFLVEVLFRCQHAGARICEIPIIFEDRRAGRSKLSRRIILESALLCLRLLAQRLTRPRWPRGGGR